VGRRRKKPTKDATQLEIYRYEASLTVDDLAEQTRIPQRHLLALEARELDKLPAPVFISGYLRNLAEFFEVDVNLLLSDYDFSKEDNLVSSLQQDDFSVDDIPLIQIYLDKVSSFFKSLSGPELLEKSKKKALLISVGVVVLLLFIFFLLADKNDLLDSEFDNSQVLESHDQFISSQKKNFDFGKINIQVNESSWIELNDGHGKRLFRDLADDGQNLEFFAPLPFELLLGFAPGVNITLNGEEYFIENIREDNSSRLIIQR